jgi:hypothetical protein
LEAPLVFFFHELVEVAFGALLHFLDGFALLGGLPRGFQLELQVPDLIPVLVAELEQLCLPLLDSCRDPLQLLLVGLLELSDVLATLQVHLLDLLLKHDDLSGKIELEVTRFHFLLLELVRDSLEIESELIGLDLGLHRLLGLRSGFSSRALPYLSAGAATCGQKILCGFGWRLQVLDDGEDDVGWIENLL